MFEKYLTLVGRAIDNSLRWLASETQVWLANLAKYPLWFISILGVWFILVAGFEFFSLVTLSFWWTSAFGVIATILALPYVIVFVRKMKERKHVL